VRRSSNVGEDHWIWLFDTVKGGDYLVDQDASWPGRQSTPSRVPSIWNPAFSRTPGRDRSAALRRPHEIRWGRRFDGHFR